MTDARRITDAYRSTKYIPLNLEIQSVALGEEGKQLAVVAHQYQEMVDEINDEIKNFELKGQEAVKKIEMGQFYTGASQLMDDVIRFLKNENNGSDAGDSARDLALLSEFYLQRSGEGLKEIIEVLLGFKKICESLQAMGAGLELVRLTGKVEIARLHNASSAGDLLNELRVFQTELSQGIKQILVHQRTMDGTSKSLLDALSEKGRDKKS
jgi:hypothetical protein